MRVAFIGGPLDGDVREMTDRQRGGRIMPLRVSCWGPMRFDSDGELVSASHRFAVYEPELGPDRLVFKGYES